MKQGVARILTAAVGIPFVLALVWLGGWYFFGFVAFVALVAQFELIGMLKGGDWKVATVWTLLLGSTLLLRPVIPFWEFWILGVVLLFCVFQLRHGPDELPQRLAIPLLCAVYPVFLISFLVDIQWEARQIFDQTETFWFMLMLFGLIWATDTGAYYTGKSIGKHKFAPSISPNKTWEGTIGGLVLSILVATLFKETLLPGMEWMDVLVLAVLGGAWGQMGDLLESAFKRSLGVKDSGNILPGHGGMLDRFDSMIFTAPAYYMYLFYVSDLLTR